MSDQFPCPCCGHRVFEEPPGSYEICGICFWEYETSLRCPVFRSEPRLRHYVCGPEGLMDTVQNVLRDLGVPGERIHQERFTSGVVTPAAVAPQEMRIEKDGRLVGAAVVVEPGHSLLDGSGWR